MNKLLLAALAAGVLLAVYFAVLPNTGQLMSGDGVGASGKISRAPATAAVVADAQEKPVTVQNNDNERYQAVSDNPFIVHELFHLLLAEFCNSHWIEICECFSKAIPAVKDSLPA